MQTRLLNTFITIHTEGALLPPDLLQRILENDHSLPGLAPEDYYLATGEKINEAINRSWNRLTGLWASFLTARGRLGPNEPGTALTRDRWLLPLFQELGYGRLNPMRSVVMDGKSFPISHAWGNVPIHIIGCGLELDKRTAGAAGAARVSPHSLVQEYLNLEQNGQWGMVSNGLKLRILRDNASLTRQAYLEFDLEAMFTGELYSDFVLLWMLCHLSRFEVREGKAEPWLEIWSKAAQEQGTRALDNLRSGVEEAITHFGRGFLLHPANNNLRLKLKQGELAPQDYYRQILRLVYRLIFLFTAEDRDLLLLPDASPQARQRYLDYYSTARLRALAERQRGSRHHDRYEALKAVMMILAGRNANGELRMANGKEESLAAGYSQLALPALGGLLFDPKSTPDLNAACLDNGSLLAAVRALAFINTGGSRRAVDYRNLGPEELGSVYESLLELHPNLNTDSGAFELLSAAGNERKTTGSYYTPSSLIKVLLDSALDPVIENAVSQARRVAVGEWRWVEGEWRMVNGEWTEEDTRYAYSVLPGFRGMAAGNDAGRRGLQAGAEFPAGGNVRPDKPGAQGSRLDPGQHRGGLGQVGDEGVSALSEYRDGKLTGTGYSPDPEPADRFLPEGSHRSSAAIHHDPGKTDLAAAKKPGEALRLDADLWNHTPLAARHSLLAERSLLDLKICDPACGSGHFLIAAAHRIAGRLAQVRARGDEPSPIELRRALRDVIRHCIYGVDINPMSVELCKVNLWLESLEPGKPLSFLDAHIQCGNSLVGVGPGVNLEDLVVPDEAFSPVTGDDRSAASLVRKRNKKECEGQEDLFVTVLKSKADLENWLAERTRALEAMPEESAAEVQAKADAYRQVSQSAEYRRQRQIADLWTAAFFWKLDRPAGTSYEIVAPTQGQLRRLRKGQALQPGLIAQVEALSQAQGFFHWPLEFSDVAAQGGFDCVLGNPPWERIKLQEQEFFAARDPEIASAPNKAARQKLIDGLAKNNPALLGAFTGAKHAAECTSKFVRKAARFALTAVGDVNTYALFAEHFRALMRAQGRAGIIVPTGIATDDTTKDFFGDLVEKRAIASLFDFENREAIFPGVHRSYKFSLLTLSGAPVKQADFTFFATRVEHLRDARRRFSLDPAEIALFNPNTRTMPVFRTRADAELTRKIYQRVPVLVNERTGENPWGISFQAMFHMSNDSGLFVTEPREGYVRLYEAKMFHQYDHRWATYDNFSVVRDVHPDEKRNPNYLISPRYWVSYNELEQRIKKLKHNWLLGFRDIARSTDERTAIFSLLPREAVGHKAPLLYSEFNILLNVCLLASLNSMVFDMVVRQKIGGTSVAFFIIKQLPVLSPKSFSIIDETFIVPRIIELIFTAFDLQPFVQEVLDEIGVDTWNTWFPHLSLTSPNSPPPPFPWDEERRALLRAELDAYFAHLYGLNRKQLRYILDPADLTPRELEDILDPWEEVSDPLDPAGYDRRRAASDFPGETFRVLKDKEINKYGEYRTRRLVLEAWERLEAGEWKEERREQSVKSRRAAAPAGPQEPAGSPKPRRETITISEVKPVSGPEVGAPAPVEPEPVPAKTEPESQPALSDFGLYKCEACGKMVMSYDRGNHEIDKHGGKNVGWKKMR